MAKSRFVKGQIVYSVCTRFSTFGQYAIRNASGKFLGWTDGPKTRDGHAIKIAVVIERQVDACGAKQVTFYDRGNNDSVFGRMERADIPTIFNTAEEAFAYAEANCDIVAAKVYSDADDEAFEEVNNGTMKFL